MIAALLILVAVASTCVTTAAPVITSSVDTNSSGMPPIVALPKNMNILNRVNPGQCLGLRNLYAGEMVPVLSSCNSDTDKQWNMAVVTVPTNTVMGNGTAGSIQLQEHEYRLNLISVETEQCLAADLGWSQYAQYYATTGPWSPTGDFTCDAHNSFKPVFDTEYYYGGKPTFKLQTIPTAVGGAQQKLPFPNTCLTPKKGYDLTTFEPCTNDATSGQLWQFTVPSDKPPPESPLDIFTHAMACTTSVFTAIGTCSVGEVLTVGADTIACIGSGLAVPTACVDSFQDMVKHAGSR